MFGVVVGVGVVARGLLSRHCCLVSIGVKVL